MPKLSAAAVQGLIACEENCATCHGRNASGTDQGPPLVHPIGRTHWRFGNMPPVEGVTDSEVEGIVAYVRELQRANGIR